MRVTVVSELVSDMYDGRVVDENFVREYLAGTDDSLLVPGVTSWDNPQVTTNDEGQIVITADLVTEDRVAADHPSGNGGQPVSQDWVRDYITGADAYWFAPEVLTATEVTFA
jgi:hypothetical protein